MEYRTFSPKDPFKPSLHYSLQNTFPGRKVSTSHPPRLSNTPFPNPDSDLHIPDKEEPPFKGDPSISPRPLPKRPPRPSSLYSFDSASLPSEPIHHTIIPQKKPFKRNGLVSIKNKVKTEKTGIGINLPFRSNLRYTLPAPFPKTNVDAELNKNTLFGVPSYALAFILDTIPRQLYHYFLLFLPSLYYSRVSRIFIDSQLSVSEIDKCILDESLERHSLNMPLWRPVKWRRRHVDVWSPYDDLEESWQALTGSFMREWNTLNIISGLLLTAIITILQIGNAGKDPLIRHTALLSMICALMSLLYGCMYIIRFGTMQKTYKGAEWAYEADKPRTAIFWNVWVMLAMPATWLGWAIIMFIVCIGSFIWRTGTTFDDNLLPHTPHQVISARVIVSFILAMGIIYFTLIILTLRKYGDAMDTAWTNRISGWVKVFYEHHRMQELRIEAMRNVMHEVKQEPLLPVTNQVMHMTEREYLAERPLSVIQEHIDYEPPSPILEPVFNPPAQSIHSESILGDGWSLICSASTSSLPSTCRPTLPPVPEPQLRASMAKMATEAEGSRTPPSPPPPQLSTMLSLPPPYVANDPTQAHNDHNTIPWPTPLVSNPSVFVPWPTPLVSKSSVFGVPASSQFGRVRDYTPLTTTVSQNSEITGSNLGNSECTGLTSRSLELPLGDPERSPGDPSESKAYSNMKVAAVASKFRPGATSENVYDQLDPISRLRWEDEDKDVDASMVHLATGNGQSKHGMAVPGVDTSGTPELRGRSSFIRPGKLPEGPRPRLHNQGQP